MTWSGGYGQWPPPTFPAAYHPPAHTTSYGAITGQHSESTHGSALRNTGVSRLPHTPVSEDATSADMNSPPYLRSWYTRDSDQVSTAIRSALAHQIQLQHAIQEMKSLQNPRTGGSSTQSAQERILQSLETSSEGLRHFISSMAHPLFFNERPGASGEQMLAQRVFEIPELLERILLDVDMKDIISMRQVSRSTQAIIKGSPKLQRRLFLLPDGSKILKLPSLLYQAPGFVVGIEPKQPTSFSCIVACFPSRHEVNASTTTFKFSAKFETITLGKLPIVGDAILDTLLCQPPITEINYFFYCCDEGVPQTGKVAAQKGLMLRHLYNKTKEIIDTHKLCPYAPASCLDEDGFVRLEVLFTADLKLTEEHLTCSGDMDKFAQLVLPAPPQTPIYSERLIHYAMAKRAAHARGYPIPTLAEYEAMLVFEDYDVPEAYEGMPTSSGFGPSRYPGFD